MNLLLIEDDHTLAQNIMEALKAEHANVKVIYDGCLPNAYCVRIHLIVLLWTLTSPVKMASSYVRPSGSLIKAHR
ncbi:hypothetical protein KRR40_00935 [Niabella defluvii]|nr:hypothetical protein KRR40_00935 [Niabella sp. I65]